MMSSAGASHPQHVEVKHSPNGIQRTGTCLLIVDMGKGGAPHKQGTPMTDRNYQVQPTTVRVFGQRL